MIGTILGEGAAIVPYFPLLQQSPGIDKATPQHMVGKHKGNHGFGNGTIGGEIVKSCRPLIAISVFSRFVRSTVC
ncbi:hypothetical protein MSWHS_2358 [Methanosarcina sp. WWM596]|nr:hypothetical protein MSWHS_2358 [Methanosarcina sp. WWM596]AKB22948.1 hypothetical protein MSWH1_2677 [Methanosarcina sp. WH1]